MTQFETDMNSKHCELFERARAFLLANEGVVETRKPRITTYSRNGKGICHLRTMPHGVDFGFLKGAKLDDKPGLLTGDGKAVRVLSLRDFQPDTIAYYVNQAIAFTDQIEKSK